MDILVVFNNFVSLIHRVSTLLTTVHVLARASGDVLRGGCDVAVRFKVLD